MITLHHYAIIYTIILIADSYMYLSHSIFILYVHLQKITHFMLLKPRQYCTAIIFIIIIFCMN